MPLLLIAFTPARNPRISCSRDQAFDFSTMPLPPFGDTLRRWRVPRAAVNLRSGGGKNGRKKERAFFVGNRVDITVWITLWIMCKTL